MANEKKEQLINENHKLTKCIPLVQGAGSVMIGFGQIIIGIGNLLSEVGTKKENKKDEIDITNY